MPAKMLVQVVVAMLAKRWRRTPVITCEAKFACVHARPRMATSATQTIAGGTRAAVVAKAAQLTMSELHARQLQVRSMLASYRVLEPGWRQWGCAVAHLAVH
jgi:hypothetical protein